MNPYFRRLQDAIESATRNMSVAELSQRPAEGKWSSAEILEHLSLTYIGTVRNLERSLTVGRPLEGAPTLKQRVISSLVVDFGYLPNGRKSPEAAEPKGMLAENIIDEINSRIAQLDDVIEKCESKFGKTAFVASHPILGPFTMQQWRKFHWVHGRHHVRQIERMRKTS
jgi:DinB superfamily